MIGHITTTKGTVTGLYSTKHYSSDYLYAEQAGGKYVTVIDITKPGQPVALGDVGYTPADGASASLLAVVGTSALISEEQGTAGIAPRSQTVRIMDFSDLQHPKVAREFAGVTATSRDDKRGLIFIANSEGVWILHQGFAADPEVQKEYDRRIANDR